MHVSLQQDCECHEGKNQILLTPVSPAFRKALDIQQELKKDLVNEGVNEGPAIIKQCVFKLQDCLGEIIYPALVQVMTWPCMLLT